MTATQTFEIKKFSTLPRRLAAGKSKYPFDKLPDGKAFTVKPENAKDDVVSRMSSAAGAASKRLGRRFTVRKVEIDGVTCARVFALKPEDKTTEE